MVGSVNKVLLVGNSVNDVEVRTFSNGGRVANFRLATNETWRCKETGERKSKAEFHNIAIFNEGLIGVIEKYVNKGSKLYIEGQLQTRKWQNRDGNDRYVTEVVLKKYRGELVLMDSKSNERTPEQNMHDRFPDAERMPDKPAQDFDLDDEIPF